MTLYNVTVREDRTFELQVEAESKEAAIWKAIEEVEGSAPLLQPDNSSIDMENCSASPA